ncbi:MAG: hypothetical protein KC546_16465 [Anaerolineae bacterium]|nr:hypothetical protein [Anaerolineae bacterium]
MFTDRKRIIRIVSVAACTGLLWMSLANPMLTGAQESQEADTMTCELVNALLDAQMTSTQWTLYPAQGDATANALSDQALRIGRDQNMLLDQIFTPVRVGRDWVLRVGILDPESHATQEYGFVFLAEDRPYFVTLDPQAENTQILLNTLLSNSEVVSRMDMASLISNISDGWLRTLPADWEAIEDTGWLGYEGDAGTVYFGSFMFPDACAPLTQIDVQRSIIDSIDDMTVLDSDVRYIGNYRWLMLVYQIEGEDETLQGRLYLRREGDRIWAIRAEVPAGTAAGTFFRQLTSSIALIAVD